MVNIDGEEHVYCTAEHVTRSGVPDFTVVWPQGVYNPVNQGLSFYVVISTEFLEGIDEGIECVCQVRVHQVKLDDFVTPNSCWVVIFTDQFTYVHTRSQAECSFLGILRFHASPDHLFTSFEGRIFLPALASGSTLPQGDDR